MKDSCSFSLTNAGLAQLVEPLSAEREVAGSMTGRTDTQGLKIAEDEGAT